jgi:hypothetical protein
MRMAQWTFTLVRRRPGQKANWLYTPAGKSWWPWCRLYGPEQFFDKTWKLPDIERVTSQ